MSQFNKIESNYKIFEIYMRQIYISISITKKKFNIII